MMFNRNTLRTAGLGVALTVAASAAWATNGAADASAAAEVAPEAVATVVGLSRGSQGPGVVAVQQKLLNFGYVLSGGADGVFGASTEAALRHFQRASGLNPTGVVTETTARYMGLSGGVTTTSPTPTAPHASTPPATGSPTSAVGLRRGNTGTAVRQLQTAVLRTGLFLSGGVDGVFGSATEHAVKLVQQVNELPQTGVVNAATARALGLTAASPAAPSTPATPTPPAASGYIGLKVGSVGPAVRAVQQALLDTGMSLRGGADGVFGQATYHAVVGFQRVNGLSQTGVVDATTARLMGLGTPSAGGNPSTPGSTGGGGYAAYDERGARVVALQQALVRAGITVPGGADGVFGSGTAGAIGKFQRAHGLSMTGKLDSATARALGLSGMPAPAPSPTPVNVSYQAVPVAGACWYGDTWHAARGSGRVHLGTDIGAAEGTPVHAMVTGRISYIYHDQPGSLAGNGLKVRAPDGTYFFYAHLSGFAPGIDLGVPVTAGQLIGYVGHTGAAAISHLHLEIHPRGGSAVNPYPILRAGRGAC